jgi:hypothetical protein
VQPNFHPAHRLVTAASLSLAAVSPSVKRFIGRSPHPVKRFVTKKMRTPISPRGALSRARQKGRLTSMDEAGAARSNPT